MPLPTTFDPLFKKYASDFPTNFMRSLGWHESRLNPSESEPPAWGLLQITPTVLQGSGFSMQDMLNPALNVQVAAGLLRSIVAGYSTHPSRNLHEDWSNPEFVKLLLAGWNSGYSEGGGVGKVAKYLESRGLPVTHDTVFQYAGQAGATPYLQDVGKQRWQRQVAATYFAEGGDDRWQKTLLYAAVTVGLVYGGYELWRRYGS